MKERWNKKNEECAKGKKQEVGKKESESGRAKEGG